MDTDSSDSILVTGDSRGYVRVWDIDGYCDVEDIKHHRDIQNLNKV